MTTGPLGHLVQAAAFNAAILSAPAPWSPASLTGVNWAGDYPMWLNNYFVWG